MNDDEIEIDQTWFANHVRSSNYLLQIIKCYKDLRNNMKDESLMVFSLPINVKQTDKGVIATSVNDTTRHYIPLFVRLSANTKIDNSAYLQVCTFLKTKFNSFYFYQLDQIS